MIGLGDKAWKVEVVDTSDGTALGALDVVYLRLLEDPDVDDQEAAMWAFAALHAVDDDAPSLAQVLSSEGRATEENDRDD